MDRVMAELGILQLRPVNIMDAVQSGPPVVRESQHHHRKLFGKGVQHGVEFRPDIAAENGTLLVNILIHPLFGKCLQRSVYLMVSLFISVESGIRIDG